MEITTSTYRHKGKFVTVRLIYSCDDAANTGLGYYWQMDDRDGKTSQSFATARDAYEYHRTGYLSFT